MKSANGKMVTVFDLVAGDISLHPFIVLAVMIHEEFFG